MVKRRIIPVILLRNGLIVQSRSFKRHQVLGTPTAAVQRLSNWDSDELIYLDITPGGLYDLNRSDLNHPEFNGIADIIRLVAKKCRMPLTFGGGIRSHDDIRLRISNGADKITLNSLAIDDRNFISAAARINGSQAVVVSIDVKREENGEYVVYKAGKVRTTLNPIVFAKECEDAGAGEVLLNSVDRDGAGIGFDIELIEAVSSKLRIPLIALGGAGSWDHFEDVLKLTNASAVAAANIFQHSENSYFNCKQYLFGKLLPIRKPSYLSVHNENL